MIRNLFFATIISVFGLLLSPGIIIAQEPGDTLWTRVYGYSGSDDGFSVRQTDDLGYIITGLTGNYPDFDVWLLKTDQYGDTLWTRTYGGNLAEYGYSVQPASDGGYIISGTTQSFGLGLYDLYLVKTDANGNAVWTRNYGTDDSEYGMSVLHTSDDGYIIAGYTYSTGPTLADLYLVKTDSNGDSVWTKYYGGSSEESGFSLSDASDGGYIFAATTTSFGAGGSDFWLLRLDQNGDTLWTCTYGGLYQETAYCVEQTSDGGYIIAGYSSSFGNGSYDVYIVRTDSLGDTLWAGIYGGSMDDYAEHICQTSDGGFIVTGYTWSNSVGSADLLVMKIDQYGNEIWSRSYGGEDWDLGHAIQPTADGGYIIAGYTQSFGAGANDLWLLKIAGEASAIDNIVTGPSAINLYENYPNPFNSSTTIRYRLDASLFVTIRIYDILGRIIKTLANNHHNPGDYRITWDAENNPSGVYFYQIQSGERSVVRRMTLLR
jgi:hypothetical protein